MIVLECDWITACDGRDWRTGTGDGDRTILRGGRHASCDVAARASESARFDG